MNYEYTVLWFSGTGNTHYAARTLAASLTAAGARVCLADMAGAAPERLSGTLIFCWPVYSYGPPRLVRNYLQALPQGSNSVYMLCTMGGGAGGALVNACRLLAAKGYTVLGGAELLMPNNYVGGRKPTERAIPALLSGAEGKIGEFAQAVLQGQPLPRRSFWLVRLLSWVLNRTFCLGLSSLGKSFKVSKACTSCGTCVRLCPVQNITLLEVPVWGSSCEQCLRCLHACPEAAIDLYGALKRGRPQYLAPGFRKALAAQDTSQLYNSD